MEEATGAPRDRAAARVAVPERAAGRTLRSPPVAPVPAAAREPSTRAVAARGRAPAPAVAARAAAASGRSRTAVAPVPPAAVPRRARISRSAPAAPRAMAAEG